MGDAEANFAQFDSMLGENLLRCAQERHLAFVHDQHTIRKKGDVVHVM